LPQPLLQQQRNECDGSGATETDAGKDHAADHATLARGDMRQDRRRRENHDHATTDTGQESPAKEPGERDRHGAGKTAERRDNHHSAQCADRTHSGAEFARDQRAGKIASQIGGTQINSIRGAEPLRGDQCGDQRRVGKACQSEPDKRCA